MTYTFPIALKLEGRACLVVGNQTEAVRRVLALVEAGAVLTLVAPQPSQELRAIAAQTGVHLVERPYRSADIEDKWLAVLCEQDAELAHTMGSDAQANRVFFCAVDLPAYNSFSHVAVARSGPVCLAIGTEGKAPALARRLKHQLQQLLDDPTFTNLVERMVRLREQIPPTERLPQLTALAAKLSIAGRFQIDEAPS